MSVRSLAPSIIASGVSAAFGMASGIAIARGLGPQLRGELASIVGWSGTLASILDLGLGFAAGYYAGKRRERASLLISQALITALCLGALYFALASFFLLPRLKLVHMPFWVQYVMLSAIPIGMAGSYVSQLILGLGLIPESNRIRLTVAFLYAIATLSFAFFGYKWITGYAFAYLGAQALVPFLGLVWLHKKPFFKFVMPSLSGIREVLSFGVRTQMASLAAQLSLRLDQLVMSLLLPSEILGQYVIAVAVAAIPMPLFTGICSVATPRIISAKSPRNGALGGIRYVVLGLILSGTLASILALAAKPIISLLFGQRYSPAIMSSQLLLLASVFQGSNVILGTTLRGIGRPLGPALGELAGMTTTVILLVLLLPAYGMLGAAVASLSAYTIATIVQFFILKRSATITFTDIFTDWRTWLSGIRRTSPTSTF